MKNLCLFSFAVCFVFMSCTEEICSPENLATTQLEDLFNCVNTPYQMDIQLNQDFTVIRDSASFQHQVRGSCMPDIDFDSFDLIMGKQALTQGFSSIEYQYFRQCERDKYLLEVIITLNLSTEAPNITYHTLVPKLEEEEGVGVEVVVQP